MKKFLKIISYFGYILVLSGCQGVVVPQDFQYKEITTQNFKLASWQRITNNYDPIKIYIEGDGASFDAYGQPTKDPTPKGALLREIAFGDNNPNVVYLARPCQYVKDSKCQQKYWTTARFAPEVITSTGEAISNIVGNNNEIILIGLSGGAQVAGLVAVTTPQFRIKKIVTIAANLDHKAWTEYHHLPPLVDSLNLADYKYRYETFPQIHYVGEDDEVIPAQLIYDFVGKDRTVLVKGANHSRGWLSVYSKIRQER